MALSGFLALTLRAVLTKAGDIETGQSKPAYEARLDFVDGTGEGQADLIFCDQRTLADGASEELDLAGALANIFSDAQVFVKVKGLLIINLSDTQTLTVGAAAANAWSALFADPSDALIIGPEGWRGAGEPAGLAVTPGTGDLLKIANSSEGDPTDYIIVVIGTSA